MLTAAEFAEAIEVPYPTVALWLREGRIKEAEPLQLGGLKVWQIPAEAVKRYKGEQKRPKRGRPKKEKPAK
jgi:predicted site-specific integrase-resolvase